MSAHVAHSTSATSNALPNLLIAGVKKAGTTSLFDYVGQHPDVFTPAVKAVNYFLPLREGNATLPPIEVYEKHFAEAGSQRYRLEAPSYYLFGGTRILGPLTAMLTDVRVIVSLRDPVHRLWSDFSMKRRERTLPVPTMTFESYVQASYDAYRTGAFEQRGGLAGFARGVYADPLESWLDVFGDRLRIMFYEWWSKDPLPAVRELYVWLDLDPSPAATLEAEARNRNRDFRSRVGADLARRTYRGVRDHLALVERAKPWLYRLHEQVNGRSNDETLTADMQENLRGLYAPANARLAVLLRDHGYQDLPGWLAESKG